MAGSTEAKPDAYLPMDRYMDLEMGKRLAALGDALGCSLDYLLLRTEVPEVNAASPDAGPCWQTGTPPAEGWYAVRIRYGQTEPETPRICWWTGDLWLRDREKNLPIDRAFDVTRWCALPKED